MGFKHAQGNKNWAKFESTTKRWTFETNSIITIPDIQARFTIQSSNYTVTIKDIISWKNWNYVIINTIDWQKKNQVTTITIN